MRWRGSLRQIDLAGAAAVLLILGAGAWLTVLPAAHADRAMSDLRDSATAIAARCQTARAEQALLESEIAELGASIERILARWPALTDLGAARAGLIRCAADAGVDVSSVVSQPARVERGRVCADITLTGTADLPALVELLDRVAEAQPASTLLELICGRASARGSGCEFTLTWRCHLLDSSALARQEPAK